MRKRDTDVAGGNAASEEVQGQKPKRKRQAPLRPTLQHADGSNAAATGMDVAQSLGIAQPQSDAYPADVTMQDADVLDGPQHPHAAGETGSHPAAPCPSINKSKSRKGRKAADGEGAAYNLEGSLGGGLAGADKPSGSPAQRKGKRAGVAVRGRGRGSGAAAAAAAAAAAGSGGLAAGKPAWRGGAKKALGESQSGPLYVEDGSGMTTEDDDQLLATAELRAASHALPASAQEGETHKHGPGGGRPHASKPKCKGGIPGKKGKSSSAVLRAVVNSDMDDSGADGSQPISDKQKGVAKAKAQMRIGGKGLREGHGLMGTGMGQDGGDVVPSRHIVEPSEGILGEVVDEGNEADCDEWEDEGRQ